MNQFFRKKFKLSKTSLILGFFVVTAFLFNVTFAYAARDTPFAPSETLDPDCRPTDANCFVQPFVVQDEGNSMTNFARGLNFIGGGVQVTTNNQGIISVRVTRGEASVGEFNWNEFRNSGIRLATSTHQVLIGANATTSLAKLEVVGDQVIRGGGFLGIGTTSPSQALSVVGQGLITGIFTANRFIGTGVGTSTFNGGISTDKTIDVGGNATSTFANGIKLSGGCVSVNGVCLTSNPTTSPAGINRQIQFNNNGNFGADSGLSYNSTTNTLTTTNASVTNQISASLINITGVGTSTFTSGVQMGSLSVNGNATSTFNQGINIQNGCISVGGVCLPTSQTSPSGINRRVQFNDNGQFGSDSGFTYNNTTNVLTVQNSLVTGSTTLISLTFLSATGTSATTTNFSTRDLNVTGSGTSTFGGGISVNAISISGNSTSTSNNGINIAGGCFSVSGVCVGAGVTQAGGANRQIQFNQNGNFGGDATLTFNNTTNTLSAQKLLVTSSTTLGGFSFATSTGLSATTTNSFSITASSTNLFSTNSTFGNTLISGLLTASGISVSDSSTLQNVTLQNSTSTSATTTNLSVQNLSVQGLSTTTFANGLNISGGCLAVNNTCISSGAGNPAGNNRQVQFNNNGVFGADAGFTYNSNTNLLSVQKINISGGSTLQGLSFATSTGVSATTTNLFATTSSSTNLFSSVANIGTLNVGNLQSLSTASTTFAGGIDLSNGCFSVNGVCVGQGSISGSGGVGQIAIWNGPNSISATTSITLSGNGRFGVGTTSPSQALAVVGNVVSTGNGSYDGSLTSNYVNVTNANASYQINNSTVLKISGGQTNIFTGVSSGASVSLGTNNSALGYRSLFSNLSGNQNVAIGTEALYNNTSGNQNVAVGAFSLLFANGSSNIGIGMNSGFGLTEGSNNIFIGVNSQAVSIPSISNSVVIGTGASVSKSNQMALGGTGSNSLSVGIGTSSPNARLSIHGDNNSQLPILLIATSSDSNASSTVLSIDSNGIINYQGFGTTTFNNGLNLTSGCFSVSGVCVAGPGIGVISSITSSDNSITTTLSGETSNLSLNISKSNSWIADQIFASSSSSVLNANLASINSLNLQNLNFSNGSGFLKTTGGVVGISNINIVNDTAGVLPVSRGGTGQTSFSDGGILVGNGSNSISVTNSPTFSYITATSTTATSTFANGINISGGCFSVNGSCLTPTVGGSGGGLDGTITSGNTNSLAYYSGATTINGANFMKVDVVTSKLGLGVSNPREQLDISGNINLTDTSSTGAGIIMKDGVRFMHNYGSQNFFAGIGSGNTLLEGGGNTSVGYLTLGQLTTGGSNTAIGSTALSRVQDGGNNVAIGNNALTANLSNSYNVAVGVYSQINSTADFNSSLGYSSLFMNITGRDNSAFGSNSLRSNVVGSNNTAIGKNSLFSSLGNDNVAIGSGAGFVNASGTKNTFIGTNAGLTSSSTINNSTAIGYNAQVNTSNSLVLGSIGVSVGIGTYSPGYPLHVVSSTGTEIAKFVGLGGTSCTLSSVTGVISCTSDERLKKNIVSYGSALDKVSALRPVTYNWNFDDDNSTKQIGFIAQEVEGVIPELVKTDSESGLKSLSTVGLIPILTKAIQEQNEKILALASLNSSDVSHGDFVSTLYKEENGALKIISDVIIDGHVYVSNDSAGVVTIGSGLLSVSYNFTKSYKNNPIVVVSPQNQLSEGTTYYVDTTNSQFSVYVSKMQGSDVKFSWIALGSDNIEVPQPTESGSVSSVEQVSREQIDSDVDVSISTTTENIEVISDTPIENEVQAVVPEVVVEQENTLNESTENQ